MDKEEIEVLNSASPLINEDLMQFEEERKCSASGIAPVTEVLLGFSMSCASRILYIKRGVDFDMTEWEAFERKFSTEDVTSESAYVQKINTAIEETGTLPIQLKGNTKVEQMLAMIDYSDSINEREGKQILEVSNGNLHLVINKIYNQGTVNEYVVQVAMLELYMDNMPNVNTGDITSETTFDWNIRVQRGPIIRTLGVAPKGWGIPTEDLQGEEIDPPFVSYGDVAISASAVDITALTISGDMDITEGIVLVRVFDKSGVLLSKQEVNVVDAPEDVSIEGVYVEGVYLHLAMVLIKDTNVNGNDLYADGEMVYREITPVFTSGEQKAPKKEVKKEVKKEDK